MKTIDQEYLHIPGKQHGDCWRACIASIIECDINDLPYQGIDDWSRYYGDILTAVESKGYNLISIGVNNMDDILFQSKATDGYIIAVGKSPRSTEDNRINHAVVWKNGIVHDPHPSREGILDINSFDVFQKK